MLVETDCTGDRKTVNVDIERRHENAHLYGAGFQEFVFLNIFDENNLAIGRCEHEVLSRRGRSVGITEEKERENKKCTQNPQEENPDHFPVHKKPRQCPPRSDENGHCTDDIISVFADQRFTPSASPNTKVTKACLKVNARSGPRARDFKEGMKVFA